MNTEALLDGLVELLAERLEARARASSPPGAAWQSQKGSPLGRKHCRVVRERMARGGEGAAQVGRKHLLSPEALREELGRFSAVHSITGSSPVEVCNETVKERLDRRLSLLKGAKQ